MKDTIKNSIMKLHIPIILIITLFSSTISYSQNINDNPALKTEYIAMQVTLKYLNIWDNSGLKETVEWNPKETSYHIEAIKKPPTNAENIILHEPSPVVSRITAPIKTAITEVSPIEPGMKPKKEFIRLYEPSAPKLLSTSLT